jgi:hypothetical protein
MPTWPDDLFQFAFIPDSNDRLAELAAEAEDEDWEYHNTPLSIRGRSCTTTFDIPTAALRLLRDRAVRSPTRTNQRARRI